MLLHLLVVSVALLAYLINPDDIVWSLVRGHSDGRMLERLVFAAGAIVVLIAAALETWVTARLRPDDEYDPGSALQAPGWHSRTGLLLARLLFVLGLGLLLPLPGTVVLIGGETMLMLRLLLRGPRETAALRAGAQTSWQTGFRVSASKWGVAASLVLLSATLQDRIAEIVAGIGFAAWLIANANHSLASRAAR